MKKFCISILFAAICSNLFCQQDTLIVLDNPRMRDGKDVHYLAENVTTVYWPVERVNFIEVLTSKEDEEIIGFVRE